VFRDPRGESTPSGVSGPYPPLNKRLDGPTSKLGSWSRPGRVQTVVPERRGAGFGASLTAWPAGVVRCQPEWSRVLRRTAESAAHAEALAQRLRQIALDRKSSNSEAISAMKLLVERAHGKPQQSVTQHTEYTHPDLIPTEELMRLLAEEEH